MPPPQPPSTPLPVLKLIGLLFATQPPILFAVSRLVKAPAAQPLSETVSTVLLGVALLLCAAGYALLEKSLASLKEQLGQKKEDELSAGVFRGALIGLALMENPAVLGLAGAFLGAAPMPVAAMFAAGAAGCGWGAYKVWMVDKQA